MVSKAQLLIFFAQNQISLSSMQLDALMHLLEQNSSTAVSATPLQNKAVLSEQEIAALLEIVLCNKNTANAGC